MKKTIIATSIFALFASATWAEGDVSYSPTTSWASSSTDIEGSYTIDATNANYGQDTLLSILATGKSVGSSNFDGANLVNGNFNAITVSTGANTDIGSLVLSSASPAIVYGNIIYKFDGGKIRMGVRSDAINEVVAGTYGIGNTVVWGNTQIDMTAGEVGASILGAGSGTTKGDATINISGGTVYGRGANVLYSAETNYDRGARGIYGGGSWNSVVEGNTYVNISGGSVQTNVFGGAYSNNTINGSTNVVISGDAEILGDVSGGSFDYKVRANPNIPIVKGDANVTILGGTIRKITEADGYNLNYIPASSASVYGATGTVEGNVNVVISGGSIEGNVYGAGNATIKTNVVGNVKVALSGNAVVGGFVYGTDGEAVVNGEKALLLQAYTGSISVANFDKIEILANSDVVFLNAFDVDTLIVENFSSMVSLSDGTSFDALTISGFDEASNSVNLGTIFGDSAGVVLSALENNNVLLKVIDSKGNEWTAENLSFEGNKVSFDINAAIPEPGTYAAILGALALAFAAYRRRK